MTRNPLWVIVGVGIIGFGIGTLSTLIMTNEESPIGEIHFSIDRVVLLLLTIIGLLILLGVVIYVKTK